jgi:hypothetical protein
MYFANIVFLLVTHPTVTHVTMGCKLNPRVTAPRVSNRSCMNIHVGLPGDAMFRVRVVTSQVVEYPEAYLRRTTR